MKIRKFLGLISLSGAALLMLAPTVSANSMHQMPKSNKVRAAKMSKLPKRHMKMDKHADKTMKNMKSMQSMNMTSMMRIHGTKAPKGLKAAKHPKFRAGSRVTIKADHMTGMKGAYAKVIGAYNTKLYEVTYRSTINHQLIRNHKWVIGKEIKSSRKGALRVGEKVTLKANHMKDMYDAKATIVGQHRGPAYMIDYRPTNHKKIMVTNHKWLTQDELAKD